MRTTTWNNIGKSVEGATNIKDALITAGLDFNVVKQPLFSELNGKRCEVKNRVATLREDTGDVLGIVGKEYHICQNRDAFDFIDYISDDLVLEKAGMTASGMMYVISKLPDVTILGDSFTPHLIFQNSFSGTYPVRAAICPLRIVCQNQLALSFRNTPNSISVRHSASMESKLLAAKKTFLETTEYMKELNNQAERLAATPFTRAQYNQFVNECFPINGDMTDLQKQRMEDVRAALDRAYLMDDNSNFRGTAYAAVNAVSDWLTHREPARKSAKFADNQFISVTFNPMLLQTLYNRLTA